MIIMIIMSQPPSTPKPKYTARQLSLMEPAQRGVELLDMATQALDYARSQQAVRLAALCAVFGDLDRWGVLLTRDCPKAKALLWDAIRHVETWPIPGAFAETYLTPLRQGAIS